MGKKKIIKQTTEEAIKETETQESAISKSSASKVSAKKFENGRVYVSATYNNTLISITDDKGNLIAWSSAGSLGFSGPKKATPFAASKVIATLAEKIKKSGPFNVEVYVNGVGSGRDSSIRSLANQGFTITAIKDVTPIPHNGPRPKKVRRV
ncbi:MAG: 30S ribosomal protein S11 [bacterium]|nr:30S ribosomal protein S11 [bacterium]